MARIYLILSVIGWTWAVVVAVMLPILLSRRRAPRGFQVVTRK